MRAPPVLILSGPIRSGKTTRLATWTRGRSDVAGLLSPDRDGGRVFVDIATGAATAMENPLPGEPVMSVGRFDFRAAAFEWANERLIAAAGDPRDTTIVVDEIGPLELAGNGLVPGIRAVLARPGGRSILVVRDHLVASVVAAFDLPQFEVATDIGW